MLALGRAVSDGLDRKKIVTVQLLLILPYEHPSGRYFPWYRRLLHCLIHPALPHTPIPANLELIPQ